MMNRYFEILSKQEAKESNCLSVWDVTDLLNYEINKYTCNLLEKQVM